MRCERVHARRCGRDRRGSRYSRRPSARRKWVRKSRPESLGAKPCIAGREEGHLLPHGTPGLGAEDCPALIGIDQGAGVLILVASTSGWSKGSIPITAPAIAVAISQRKNSWPIGSSAIAEFHHWLARRHQARRHAGRGRWSSSPRGSAPRRCGPLHNPRRGQRLEVDRHDALAVLAGGFGEQLLEPGAERLELGRSQEVKLVAAGLAAAPRITPRSHARICRGRARRPACLHHRRGRLAKKSSTSIPSSPPAPCRTRTTPNNARRSPDRRGRFGIAMLALASFSSFEPGSVTAMKRLPSLPDSSQKYSRSSSGSIVEPIWSDQEQGAPWDRSSRDRGRSGPDRSNRARGRSG